MTIRVGIGYDAHRFAAGRRLMLGGVAIPADQGLAGHSDADVLLHAVMDALLGAAGLADIGTHFPDTDPRYKDAESLQLLRAVGALLGERGFTVGNLDATVIAEAPKIAPHVPAMRERMAAALAIDAGCIGIKATTNEGMGWIGRGEGIAAMAVAVIMTIRK